MSEPDATPKLTAAGLVEQARAEIEHVSTEEARRLLVDDGWLFVDVREREELAAGRIPGAVHATRGNLEFYLDPESAFHMPELAAGRTLIFVCGSGGRGALATKLARAFGLDAVCLTGGMRAWIAAGAPTDRDAAP